MPIAITSKHCRNIHYKTTRKIFEDSVAVMFVQRTIGEGIYTYLYI